MSMKNKTDAIGNRTRDLPAFTAVPPFCIIVRKLYPELSIFFFFFHESAAIFWGAEQEMVPFGAPVKFKKKKKKKKKKNRCTKG
jgi:hypothetical protein